MITIQPSFGNYIDERPRIADISAFGELRLEQRLYDCILDTIGDHFNSEIHSRYAQRVNLICSPTLGLAFRT